MAVTINLHQRIGIRVYTFGKAMGVHGACVAGSHNLVHYLINFARPFIYTTAMPAHSIASIECAFTYLQQHTYLQQALRDKIELYHRHARLDNHILSTSAIQTARFPGNRHCRNAAAALQAQGLDVRPILSPTVAQGAERLRICLHTYNSNGSVQQLCSALNELVAQLDILPDNA
jgi:8-amino-7-oxononanoate synthase